jgi:hypothetical protein
MSLTLLGPQRRPTLEPVARAYGPEVRFATVTAGWEEREADDAELDGLLGGRSVNLGLHRRWHDVLDGDHELATAAVDHRAVLDELQDLYAIRLDHAVRAVEAIQRSSGRPRTRAAALADAEAALRLLDEQHLRRVATAQADFEAAWRPAERPAVAAHRAEVAALIAGAGALVVAGGHVGVLLRLLAVFGVAATPPPAVIAWSAGAMALTDRVVLFGSGPAEAYAAGVGLLPGAVLFPHFRRRLPVDDPVRLGVLARRFAPARCVVLDDGVRIDVGPDGELPADARVIGPNGHVVAAAVLGRVDIDRTVEASSRPRSAGGAG